MAKRINLTIVISALALTLILMICALGTQIGEEPFTLENAVFSNGSHILAFEGGRFGVAYNEELLFENARAEFKVGERLYSSEIYKEYDIFYESVCDSRGEGICVSVISKDFELPTLKQSFTFYNESPYFLTECTVSGSELSSNYISPIVLDCGLVNESGRWEGFLEVPFDNDAWVKYVSHDLTVSGLSHEVGAFYNLDSKEGLIIGSLTHDKWKSAVSYEIERENSEEEAEEKAKMTQLRAYSGANTALTRDQSPHGAIEGESVSSATFMVGVYEDWQEGLREYARANLTYEPKRERVTDKVPVGWNSWGAVQTDISYDTAIGISDYVEENLQEALGAEGNTVYINLDSYWDNMSESELKAFVSHCKQNGQEAGIYYSPFVTWHDENGISSYTLGDSGILIEELVLKKSDGTRYGNDIDGCYPLDVTHPAVVEHYKSTLERLIGYGFSYIKLDFLVHGSLEGQHYNESIRTGIQAYNYAMSEATESIGEDVYINLAMAPIFPYRYANGRRLACDTYYSIGDTKYMLNGLTYGFWQAELYDYIDPDNIVLWGKSGKATETEAVSRMISGVITGGNFLAGDNLIKNALNHQKAEERINALLTNEALIEVLNIGKPFTALIEDYDTETASVYTLEHEGVRYIAVFNFNVILSEEIKVYVGTDYNSITSLVDGASYTATEGVLRLKLAFRGAALIKIE